MESPCILDAAEDRPRGFITFGSQHVSIHRLAREHDLDYGYLWRIFKGGQMPSLTYADKLSEILGISIDSLLSELKALRKKVGRPQH